MCQAVSIVMYNTRVLDVNAQFSCSFVGKISMDNEDPWLYDSVYQFTNKD